MLKNICVAAAGLVACIYLLNPGMGMFEIIPDTIPVIGNLDEAAAAALLFAALRYFGFDITRFFSPRTTSLN